MLVLVGDHVYIETHRSANIDFNLITFVLINNAIFIHKRLSSLNLKIDHSGTDTVISTPGFSEAQRGLYVSLVF